MHTRSSVLRSSAILVPLLLLAIGCQTTAATRTQGVEPTATPTRSAARTPTRTPTRTPPPTRTPTPTRPTARTRTPTRAATVPPAAQTPKLRIRQGGREYEWGIIQLSLSADERQLVIVPRDLEGAVDFWDMTAGAPIASIGQDALFGVGAAWFAPQSSRLALILTPLADSADQSSFVGIIDAAQLQRKPYFAPVPEEYEHLISLPQGGARQLAWHPSEQQIAVGFEDGTVGLLDLGSRRLTALARLPGLSQLTWHPDGRRLAITAARSTWLQVWDVPSRRRLLEQTDERLVEQSYPRISSAWSPDGRYLVAGALRGDIVMYDAASLKPLRSFEGNFLWATALDWSPDGRYIVGGMHDGRILIWEAQTGEPVVFENNPALLEVAAVEWAARGSTIITGDIFGQLLFWDFLPGSAPPAPGAPTPTSTPARVPTLNLPTRQPTRPAGQQTLIDVLRSDGELRSVQRALEAAGLDELLSGSDEYTLLAPSNSALERFEAIVPDFRRFFERGDDPDLLRYHIIPGRYTIEELVARETVRTLLGQTMTFSRSGQDSTIYINQAANFTGSMNIYRGNRSAANGYLHSIDSLLLPPEK